MFAILLSLDECMDLINDFFILELIRQTCEV